MANPIQPLQQADLPERKLPFWKMTGPGAVLVGLSIGAGEIIIWPRIAAEYGSSMLWAAALGVFLQLWINIEIGRWVIATGETPYTAYSRAWRGFAVLFILFNFFGWFFPGWALASGSALKALLLGPDHTSPNWMWTGVTFIAVTAVLFGPKRIYATVEKLITGLVLIITIGLIYIAFRVGTWDNVVDVFHGVMNFGYIDPKMSIKGLFIAMVFAGAGGTANLFYAYYLRDKQIGMGARIPVLLNPFRQREESTQSTGYTFPETEENKKRFRDWMRYIIIDQTLYFWLLNTLTMFLFIFGALVVLHPKGIIPAKGTLIWDEAMILADSMGPMGRYLFLIIGLATLFSTQLTLVDGVARTLSDIIHTTFKPARRIPLSKWYAGVAIFMIVFGVLITMILEQVGVSDLGFLFNAAYIGGFAMAVFTPLMLYINMRHLPKSARPRLLNIIMVSLASVIYISLAIVSLCTTDRAALPFVIGLPILIFWGLQLLHLMKMSDEDFNGSNDKLIWGIAIIMLPVLGALLFWIQRLVRAYEQRQCETSTEGNTS